MKNRLLQLALVFFAGLAGLGFFPNTAAANTTAPLMVANLDPAPVTVQPVEIDFADAEFERADQANLGARVGGNVVVVGGGHPGGGHHGGGHHGGWGGGDVFIGGGVSVVVLVVLLLILL